MRRLVQSFLYIEYKKFASLNGYIIGLKVWTTCLQNYLVAYFNRTIRIERLQYILMKSLITLSTISDNLYISIAKRVLLLLSNISVLLGSIAKALS